MRPIFVLAVLICFGAAMGVARAADSLSANPIAAAAAKTRAAAAAPVAVSVLVFEPVRGGYLTPAFGGATLGVLPEAQFLARPLGTRGPASRQDFAAWLKAGFLGSQLGLFGGFNSRANMFESAPTNGWNVGASVGYAGLYLRAGVSADTVTSSVYQFNDTNRGWLAGVGYEFGGFDVRVTYMAAEPTGFFAAQPDSRLWMIGGIYHLTPRIRFNADAFTGARDQSATLNVLKAPSKAVASQGTGARVGVQLKF